MTSDSAPVSPFSTLVAGAALNAQPTLTVMRDPPVTPPLPSPSGQVETQQSELNCGVAVPGETTSPTATSAALIPTVALEQALPALNQKRHAQRMSKVRVANLAIRETYWPGIKAEELWLLEDGKRGGFAQVPRTLSIMMNLINDITKRREGKAVPAGKTYLVLWLKVFDDGFLRIDDEKDAAFDAGYEGERNVTTFRAHMRILQELGFIDFRAGHKNPTQYVLMRNPYKVVKRLFEAKLVPEKHYTALIERLSAIGSAKELRE